MTGRELLCKAIRNETTPRPAWVPFVGVHGAALAGVAARDRWMRLRGGRRAGRWLAAGLFLLLFLAGASARNLRVATYNVEHGIGAAGTEKGDAQRAILRRVNADIVAFQELNRRTFEEWERLAGELGYPHRAFGEMGPFAGGMVVGFFSRYPIVESATVRSPEGAREMSRLPLRVVVEVPGAAHPLTLWNMHHKALFRPVDDFRRAVEAARIVEDIARTAAAHPERAALILLGDMNDDEARRDDPEQQPPSASFDAPPEGLPRTFVLGGDIRFPLRYGTFPLETYRRAGPGFVAVDAVREGTDRMVTHLHTRYRLDYVFVSEAIRNHPAGPPVGEVYHSEWETGAGLPKFGDRPPPGATDAASDHYVVFVDLHLEAAPDAPGSNSASNSAGSASSRSMPSRMSLSR